MDRDNDSPLKRYFRSLPPAQREDFSRRCGTTIGYMQLVVGGHRRCRESLAIAIDRESGGVVTVEELRPDVDWAYVRTRTPAEATQ